MGVWERSVSILACSGRLSISLFSNLVSLVVGEKRRGLEEDDETTWSWGGRDDECGEKERTMCFMIIQAVLSEPEAVNSRLFRCFRFMIPSCFVGLKMLDSGVRRREASGVMVFVVDNSFGLAVPRRSRFSSRGSFLLRRRGKREA